MKKVLKIAAIHLVCILVLVLYALFVKCVFRQITGIDCPFCGMTRAHICFLRGEIAEAFSYHRLFPLGIPFLIALAHLRVLKSKKPLFIADLCVIAVLTIAFLINYIVNLIS